MTFAAVLAVFFKPLVGTLVRKKLKPTLAAGLVVLGLLVLMAGVVVATVHGVTEQTDQISASADKAVDKAAEQTDALGCRQGLVGRGTQGHRGRGPDDHDRRPRRVVSGFSTLIAIASGVILGALIMYYLLKDGTASGAPWSQRSTLRSAPTSTTSSVTRAGPPRLRAGSHRHVGHRVGVHRRRRPPVRLAARVHDHRRELHRRLHPVHRRVPRRRTGRDHRPRRRRAPRRRDHARSRCSPRTSCSRTSSSPRSWATPSTSTRSSCSSSPPSVASSAASSASSWPSPRG